jgi:hypothetical protein
VLTPAFHHPFLKDSLPPHPYGLNLGCSFH